MKKNISTMTSMMPERTPIAVHWRLSVDRTGRVESVIAVHWRLSVDRTGRQ